MLLLKQSTAATVKIGPFLDSTDGSTAETALTLSQADIRLSKNGANIAQKNESSAATHDELGYYDCDLDTTDTGTLGRLQLIVHESGALPIWHEYTVLPANVYDSLVSGSDNLEVDATAISGDATAANNAESFFDGTGYAGTNNVIPTVTTLTGHTPQTGDNYARLGAPAGASIAADLAEIEGQTDDIGAAGAGLTALPWNAAWDAEVQSEVTDALTAYDPPTKAELDSGLAALNDVSTAEVNAQVDTALADIHLDHLLAATYDPASKPGAADALLNEIIESDAGVSRFTENALEQAPSGTGASAATIADAVWEEALADHSGTSGSTAEALNGASAPTAAAVADAVWDEAQSAHIAAGSFGEQIALILYDGPRGPGIYLNDAAGNTNTAIGTDGTIDNPVSTIAAATTLAATLGTRRIYLLNDSAITLAASYDGYEFIGIGDLAANSINLGSQDVDLSAFHNLLITGTQGGTGRISIFGGGISSIASLEAYVYQSAIIGNTTVRASADSYFDQCWSAVAGNGTPELTFAASANVSWRHYSGGLQINSMAAGNTMSYETDGQIVIDGTCSGGALTIRGNCSLTDNASAAVTVTELARIDIDQIEDTVWDAAMADHQTANTMGKQLSDVALTDELPSSPPTAAQNADAVWDEALSGHTGAGSAAKALADIETDTTALNDTALPDSVPADGSLPTLKQAIYMINQFLMERGVAGTTVTVKKVDGSTSLMTFTLDHATTPTSITRST